jgi:HD-like signal output (HDOD) protein
MAPPLPSGLVADTIARLRARLQGGELAVPPYPAIAARIQQLSTDERAGSRTLAELVGRDPALAALVIRHASVAATAGRGAILTLEQAVWKVGAAELARIALAASVGGLATHSGPLANLRRDRWRRALLSAVFAQELAPRRGLHADQAFLAGLIHDLGAVIALTALEAELPPGLTDDDAAAAVEEVHIEVGLMVAQRWNLPEALREIISNHHDPGLCLRIYRPQVTLIHIVDQIVERLAGVDGLDGLRDVAGLDHDERFRIGALIPQVGALMASFEAYLPLAAAPAAIAPVARVDGWPLDLAVTLLTKRGDARAVWLTPTVLVIHAPIALAINWLTSLHLGDGADGFELLANVVGCAADPTGGFLVTAQPFALDGPIKVAWLELINQARRRAVAAAS